MNRPYCYVVRISGQPRDEIRTVNQRSGLPHVMREILDRNPAAAVEVYELEPRPTLAPTPDEREGARQRAEKRRQREDVARVGAERKRDADRLAALEHEAELLRLRLGSVK